MVMMGPLCVAGPVLAEFPDADSCVDDCDDTGNDPTELNDVNVSPSSGLLVLVELFDEVYVSG